MPSPIHKTTYPAISPLRRELSTKGKNALITGGGSGIGASTAKSFAKSGVTNLALLGRTGKTLLANKTEIEDKHPQNKVWTYTVDISDSESTLYALEAYAKAVNGKIDILIANAGYMPKAERITVADPDDWWSGFEINTKGNFNLLRAFDPLAAPGARVIHVSSRSTYIECLEGFSGYRASKLAAYKLFSWYANENSDKVVYQFDPGFIFDTGMTAPFEGLIKEKGLVGDDVELPSDFSVWLASDEANFLSGRFVECVWDVEDLKAAKEELKASWNKWTIGLLV
ncbi:hypothetical protein HYE67_005446 [Fusarium culmorum]|uniref:Peroxisomal short-chain alcohol dehydrogenase n=1 Tax=Fusarium culmorum TaxID=5516 RepID=A0A2T4GFJ8_FUSCU|nr:hypothetical protein FCULG_00012035 [Fusarium culmorum]QPC63215.1 hypothetical protein HYE67_005446 [Fusarium culmorum]